MQTHSIPDEIVAMKYHCIPFCVCSFNYTSFNVLEKVSPAIPLFCSYILNVIT